MPRASSAARGARPIAATLHAGRARGRRARRARARVEERVDAVGRREHQPLVARRASGTVNVDRRRSRSRAARSPRRRAPRAGARSSLACSRARVTTTRAAEQRALLEPRRGRAPATSPTTIALGASHAGVGDRGERGPHGALLGPGAVAHRGDRRVGRAPAVDQAPGDLADAARAHEDHERAADAGERVPVDVGACPWSGPRGR